MSTRQGVAVGFLAATCNAPPSISDAVLSVEGEHFVLCWADMLSRSHFCFSLFAGLIASIACAPDLDSESLETDESETSTTTMTPPLDAGTATTTPASSPSDAGTSSAP